MCYIVDMTLQYTFKKPENREDILMFIDTNFTELKFLYYQRLSEWVSRVTIEDCIGCMDKGESEYGDFDLYSIVADIEGYDEVKDGFIYFAWEKLQEHYSSPNSDATS